MGLHSESKIIALLLNTKYILINKCLIKILKQNVKMFRMRSLFRLIMVSFSTMKSIGNLKVKYFVFKSVSKPIVWFERLTSN